jgi:hypothetical protein
MIENTVIQQAGRYRQGFIEKYNKVYNEDGNLLISLRLLGWESLKITEEGVLDL